MKARIGSGLLILKWEVENLLLLMLSNPKVREAVIPSRYSEFDTACIFINLYKDAERAETRFLIDNVNILTEMQRIGHKQFLWQRGFFTIERMYRYFYVYGRGACAAYFAEKYALTIDEFALGCIALYCKAELEPWQKVPTLEAGMGLRPEIIDLTMNLISKDLDELRADTAKRMSEVASYTASNLTYLPSSLRQFPIITSKEKDGAIIAPLPELIMLRATAGLYYDLAGGPQALLEEANGRFEEYGKKLIEARCPRFTVSREQEFGAKKGVRFKTPDLLLKDGDEIKVVFECKATKLTFVAQYADDQYSEAPKAFDQIAKGMSQLWRFFSRARRGIYNAEKISPDAYGVILTMDFWFSLHSTQLPYLRKKAEALVTDDPDVLPEDMRDVVFCPIEDLDDLLAMSTEDEFLETLKKSREPKYLDWQLPLIRNPGYEKQLERKPYPFNVSEVLPLWDRLVKAHGGASK